ncbi:hypothetical protein RF11_06675 [Thelohanellus kitauei]|uniref:Uncharacterized protein n=1 Tax=Thelohanellus kitauei TaxID=669202 RepID=A0A0C2MBJ8_THEKT|nr:hypothetical protein RF11_06675 [Thelohanellus kitauei]
MDVVVRCVNKICKSALNRLEFRQFLSDMNEEYGELLLHCEVRWLSKGKVLSRFWALKNNAFLTLKTRLLEKTFNVLQYQMTLESILEALEYRLDELEKEKNNVALFKNPFLFPESKIYKLHENLQLEIFELTCNSIFQSRILEESVKPSFDHIISFC